MKDNDLYAKIDKKFIQAVDKIVGINKEIGIKPSNDSSIGKLIYPSNRSIISSVRGKSKHIPHTALINLAKEFNLDMNYFYYDGLELNYAPNTSEVNISAERNAVVNNGNNNTVFNAGKGNIKGINTAKKGSSNSVMAVDTMINNFTSKLDKEYADQFFVILHKIHEENNKVLGGLERLLIEKTTQMKAIAAEHKEDTKSLREELKEANERAFKAQESENEILKKYFSEFKRN
ncbi:hypothetical protein [Flavivirga rizhaonensis]|uniref:Uncharacterized protein n=1 Tax=Flavivirga rizhaonensis TaxID=2559571 RepID=A0A4S1E117_9FLAO|nr:hypothetical protein [Flavivirga rizhaonensis]TGV03582.1 hypothetical protein EM932_06015 [Flavivirga rizhaonensis]